MINRFTYRLFCLLLLLPLMVLTACDSEPPTLMKAIKQFESNEKRDQHIEYMRTHHMHALKHKRDETMYNGIRTEEHSLNACIDCHVPTSHNGKVLRHTDQEHFCTTCHTYVAEKLNCFECHIDHPDEAIADSYPETKIKNSENEQTIPVSKVLAGKNLIKMSKQELIDLAFTYSKEKPALAKLPKSGGMYSTSSTELSFKDSENKDSEIKTEKGGSNE